MLFVLIVPKVKERNVIVKKRERERMVCQSTWREKKHKIKHMRYIKDTEVHMKPFLNTTQCLII